MNRAVCGVMRTLAGWAWPSDAPGIAAIDAGAVGRTRSLLLWELPKYQRTVLSVAIYHWALCMLNWVLRYVDFKTTEKAVIAAELGGRYDCRRSKGVCVGYGSPRVWEVPDRVDAPIPSSLRQTMCARSVPKTWFGDHDIICGVMG